MQIMINWLLRALIILAAAYLIPGFAVESLSGALVLVLVLSVLNVLVKPILFLLTLPINLLTLGLFTIIINAIVLAVAVALVPGVEATSFGVIVLATVVMSLLSLAVGKLK